MYYILWCAINMWGRERLVRLVIIFESLLNNTGIKHKAYKCNELCTDVGVLHTRCLEPPSTKEIGRAHV